MSKETCPRYSRSIEKHVFRKENSCDTIPTRSKSQKDQSIQGETILNLQTDLAMVVSENIKLANKNAMLTVNVQECEDKIKKLEDELKDNRVLYKNEMFSFQERLKELQNLLTEKTEALRKIEQGRSDEIANLKRSHTRDQDMAISKQQALIDEIGNLKEKLEDTKKFGKDVSIKLKRSKEKLGRYKDKFKVCTEMITKMNTYLNLLKTKPPQIDRTCQTDLESRKISLPGCTYNGCHNQCENIILSQLFFKDHGFQSAVEEIFFDRDQTFN